ncbi:MAG: hypothetical protein OEW88_12520 [Gammaproteobacteria bacterium]|nr:hypothetical protein [Gammaproteobacteria bacterium]
MALLVAASLLTAGCAFNLADVTYTPSAPLEPATSNESFTLDADVRIDRAPCNYDRVLKAGTRWETVGSLPEGQVFRSRDQVLTLECSNVFEAYPIVAQARIVAFYLPVERAIVKIPRPVPLPAQTATKE